MSAGICAPLDVPRSDAVLARFAQANVLIIDDNQANVALLRAFLVRAGLRAVYTHTDPREALAHLEEIRPDLVLVDLHMPHVDGYEVLGRLATYAAASYLPSLVLTADTSPAALSRALGAGARDFLTKPFDVTEVLLRVRNLLEARFLHKELAQHNRWLRTQVKGLRLVEQHERVARQVQQDRISRVIREQALSIVFQPVFDLSTGAVVGLEALARFPSEPKRGPDLWFAEAASVGLGVDLEILAVRAALDALDEVPAPIFLAVNVSPRTVLSPELRAACPPHVCPRLVLELTEHVPVEDYDTLNRAVTVFRDRGARLAADDVGAGYSGFNHLLALRPDIVKADLCVTHGIDIDPARRALLSALVQFTADTGAELIAEGVETAAELEAVQDLATPWAQGYHLCVPKAAVGAALRGLASP